MGPPTGAGNYPPGVTDNDPHFEAEEPETYLDDEERFGELPDEIDQQTGFIHE